MKILVPTDFSRLSNIALDYAIEIAKKFDAELYLLHNIYLDTHARSMAAFKSDLILKAMTENAETDFKRLIADISNENFNRLKISTHVVKGEYFEDEVERFAIKNDINFIVIGTKGATGMKKLLLGSNAAALIKKSKIPVIAVPEHSRFREVRNLVYSSDLQDVYNEISIIISFAEVFNSTIHIVHVDEKGKLNDEAVRKMEDDLKIACKYDLVKIKAYRNISFSEALERYIDDINADLLVMFTHKHSFFDNLFGKSVTREMAFHNRIPLMAIKK